MCKIDRAASSSSHTFRNLKRDNPNAEVHFFDTGHFALETHAEDIGAQIIDFLDRAVKR